ERGRGRLFRGAMRGITPPAIYSAGDQAAEYGKQDKHCQNGQPDWRAGKFVLVSLGNGQALRAARQVIFGKQIFFVEAEIARNRPHKPTVENATGKLLPLLVFERFEKARANTRAYGHFLERNFTQLALALESFAKSSRGHQ